MNVFLSTGGFHAHPPSTFSQAHTHTPTPRTHIGTRICRMCLSRYGERVCVECIAITETIKDSLILWNVTVSVFSRKIQHLQEQSQLQKKKMKINLYIWIHNHGTTLQRVCGCVFA